VRLNLPGLHTRPGRILAVLLIAIACALTTGALHALVLLLQRYAFAQIVWYSREFVWMSPISYLVLALPLAALLALVAAIAPRLMPPWVPAFVFVMFGVVGILLPFTEIARIATFVLALGAAMQTARAVRARPEPWVRRAAITSLVIAVATPLTAFGMRAWRSFAERRSVAALPAPAASAPNVLLIILDTVRAASLSLYGSRHDTTPLLTKWAKDGVVFDWAFSTAPWTLPSHGSLFTGRYGSELSGDWTSPLDDTHPVLAEAFRARGYVTGGFVANDDYTAWDSGLDRGFMRYQDYMVSGYQLLVSSSYAQTALYRDVANARSFAARLRAVGRANFWINPKHEADRITAETISGRFLEWQREHPDRPFFAFLNYFDAHQPYYAPRPLRRFNERGQRGNKYHNAIAYIDGQLDSVFTELARRGVLDNTIVIVTSDHGELFGEHGFNGHAHNMYLNTLRVPLLVRFPGTVPANRRVDRAVSLRDLPATIAQLAGLPAGAFPGVSLTAAWSADTSVPFSPILAEVTRAPNIEPRYPTARGPMKSLFSDSLHFIRNGDDTPELYAYRTDSLEQRDLAKGSEGQTLVARWRAELERVLKERR
jgi:arylsulfatase A-like enzyme